MDGSMKASDIDAYRTCERCGHKVKNMNMYLDVRCWCGGVFYPMYVVRETEDGETVVLRIDSI